MFFLFFPFGDCLCLASSLAVVPSNFTSGETTVESPPRRSKAYIVSAAICRSFCISFLYPSANWYIYSMHKRSYETGIIYIYIYICIHKTSATPQPPKKSISSRKRNHCDFGLY